MCKCALHQLMHNATPYIYMGSMKSFHVYLLHQGCERPYFFMYVYYHYTLKVQGRQLRPQAQAHQTEWAKNLDVHL